MFNKVNTVFKQFFDLLPLWYVEYIVGQHNLNKYNKTFSFQQLLKLIMITQLASISSLRELQTFMKANSNKWYHLGINSSAKSTISRHLNKTDYRLFENIFYKLLSHIKLLELQKNTKFDFKVFSLDASLIELTLSVFNWAKYRKSKWAVKLHALLDNNSFIPQFIHITNWNIHEINIAKQIIDNIPAYSILLIDRWYVDFSYFRELENKHITFVTRTKKNLDFTTIKETIINKDNVLSDKRVFYINSKWKDWFWWKDLRIVTVRSDDWKVYELLTNNFDISAKDIAILYRNRWKIEMFFKWIKQNLRIKSFLWTSKNAVLSQIYIAMICFLVISYIKHLTKSSISILEITRTIKSVLMERVSLFYIIWLSNKSIADLKNKDSPFKQLALF